MTAVSAGEGLGAPDLRRLVGDADLDAVWEREPLVARDLGPFDDVLSVAAADRIVSGGGLRIPSFRMVSAGRSVDPARYTRPGIGPRPVEGLIDPAKVTALVRDGATLVLTGLRRYCTEVDAFCRRVGAQLGHPVHANAYLTPQGAVGAGPHWDPHSVFIRQVAGRKRWRVGRPVERWPRTVSVAHLAAATEPAGEWELGPGDCLYLPRGFVHEGRAVEASPSTHVTIALHDPVTWVDLVGAIVRTSTDDEPGRAILPPRFAEHPADVERSLAERRDVIVDALLSMDVAAAARRLVAEQRHIEPDRAHGRLAALMTSPDDHAQDYPLVRRN